MARGFVSGRTKRRQGGGWILPLPSCLLLGDRACGWADGHALGGVGARRARTGEWVDQKGTHGRLSGAEGRSGGRAVGGSCLLLGDRAYGGAGP